MLGEQLHATLHDLSVVHFVDWADHCLQDKEETLNLGVV